MEVSNILSINCQLPPEMISLILHLSVTDTPQDLKSVRLVCRLWMQVINNMTLRNFPSLTNYLEHCKRIYLPDDKILPTLLPHYQVTSIKKECNQEKKLDLDNLVIVHPSDESGLSSISTFSFLPKEYHSYILIPSNELVIKSKDGELSLKYKVSFPLNKLSGIMVLSEQNKGFLLFFKSGDVFEVEGETGRAAYQTILPSVLTQIRTLIGEAEELCIDSIGDKGLKIYFRSLDEYYCINLPVLHLEKNERCYENIFVSILDPIDTVQKITTSPKYQIGDASHIETEAVVIQRKESIGKSIILDCSKVTNVWRMTAQKIYIITSSVLLKKIEIDPIYGEIYRESLVLDLNKLQKGGEEDTSHLDKIAKMYREWCRELEWTRNDSGYATNGGRIGQYQLIGEDGTHAVFLTSLNHDPEISIVHIPSHTLVKIVSVDQAANDHRDEDVGLDDIQFHRSRVITFYGAYGGMNIFELEEKTAATFKNRVKYLFSSLKENLHLEVKHCDERFQNQYNLTFSDDFKQTGRPFSDCYGFESDENLNVISLNNGELLFSEKKDSVINWIIWDFRLCILKEDNLVIIDLSTLLKKSISLYKLMTINSSKTEMISMEVIDNSKLQIILKGVDSITNETIFERVHLTQNFPENLLDSLRKSSLKG